jgi:hypothetical protein
MKEFVCPDGTMSVDGVCRMFMTAEERESLKFSPQKSFDQKYESIEDIPITQGTTPKTDLFTGVPKTDTSLKSPGIIDTKSFLDQYKSKEISSSPIDKVIDTVNKVTQPVKDMVSKVPKGFDFDFEQVTEFKETAQSVIDKNVNFYDNVLADKLGIDADKSKQLRALSVIGGVATKGTLASVVGPFAIPFIAGGIMRDKETQRIQNITAQDPQGALPQITSPRIMNIQPTAQDIYRGGGGDRPSSPTRTSQGVTSAQYQAFRM